MKSNELQQWAMRVAGHYHQTPAMNWAGPTASFVVDGEPVLMATSNDLNGLTIKVGEVKSGITRYHFIGNEMAVNLMIAWIDQSVQFLKGR